MGDLAQITLFFEAYCGLKAQLGLCGGVVCGCERERGWEREGEGEIVGVEARDVRRCDVDK